MCNPVKLGAVTGFLLVINTAISDTCGGKKQKTQPKNKKVMCHTWRSFLFFTSHRYKQVIQLSCASAAPVFVRDENASLLPKGIEV